jgi:hypothetical protein
MLRTLILTLLLSSFESLGGSNPAAAIEGATTTDGGAPLPGVKIVLDSLTRYGHFEATSNRAGVYAIENLSPGSYTILADAKGFGCVVIPKVIIEPGRRLKQDFEFLHSRKKLGCPVVTKTGT